MRGWFCVDIGITVGAMALIFWLRPLDWKLTAHNFGIGGWYVHVGPLRLEWL